MRNDQIVDSLSQVPIFAQCSKKDLKSVVRHGERLGVEGGTDLVVQGSEGSAFYLVLDGTAIVRRNGRKVATLGPGDFFGELALLDPAPRNATVTAADDVEVLALSTRMFNVVIRDLPRLRRGVLGAMADRLRSLDSAV